MVRTNQGGSILNFLVLGSVMAILVVGGAYLIRHNLAPAERGPQIAAPGDRGESPKQTPNNQPAPAPKNDQPAGPNNTEPKTAQNGDSNNSSTQNTKTPQSAPTDNRRASNGLPTTGPASAPFAGVMLSSLAALLLAYVQSRRIHVSL